MDSKRRMASALTGAASQVGDAFLQNVTYLEVAAIAIVIAALLLQKIILVENVLIVYEEVCACCSWCDLMIETIGAY